jgi:hypothetical protein
MDTSRNDLLGEIAADAALERSDFLVRSTEQLHRFLNANKSRIAELGGLTLIDEDPDYLAVAPDITFRSRTRFIDDLTGDWTSEAEAAREAAGMAAEPTATADMLETAGIGIDEAAAPAGADPYAAAADEWAAANPLPLDADDDEVAAQRLYDLALEFQERSQRSESRLLEQFEDAAGLLSARIGDLIINDDDDERLTLSSTGVFKAEVLTEEENEWRPLANAEELVEYYDPTDVFGDLADALAEAYPSIAPELNAEAGATNGTGPDGATDGEAGEGDDDDEASDAAEGEGTPRA